MKVYAVINQKGGVGKTTTVANLGAVAARRGHDTCLIDLDPQAHLTLHFGIDSVSVESSIYGVMLGQARIDSAILQVADRLRVVPSLIDLAAAEVELAGTVGREQILRDRLHEADLSCEMVLIDCPPSLGLLTLNALTAADEVLIPLQPHFLALQGLGKLLETILLVQKRINPRLKVAGIVFCMYETATRLAGEVVADLEQFLDAARGSDLPWSDAKVFNHRIRRNIKLAESPSHGKTIFDYDPHCHGACDYLALGDEFLASALPVVGNTDDDGARSVAPVEPADASAAEPTVEQAGQPVAEYHPAASTAPAGDAGEPPNGSTAS